MRMHTITTQHTTHNTPLNCHQHNYTYIHTYIRHSDNQHVNHHPYTLQLHSKKRKETREKKHFIKWKKGDIGIREKAHKQDTSQTQQPHFTIVTSAPTSPFQHKSHSTTTSHIQNKISMLLSQPLHSHPKQKGYHSYSNTKSQSKYNMILYACTNEKYLIPISVPILPHTTESYPTLHFSIPQTSSLYYTNNTHLLSLHTLMPLPTPHHCLYNSTSPQTSPPLHYNSTAYTLPTRHPHKPTLHLNPHIQLTIHYTTPTPTHYI